LYSVKHEDLKDLNFFANADGEGMKEFSFIDTRVVLIAENQDDFKDWSEVNELL